MSLIRLAFFLPTILFAVSLLAQEKLAPPPETPKHPVTDVYHGVQVVDDYRWLEDWNDPAVKAWSKAENDRTRAYLDSLPARAALHDRLTQLMAQSSASYGGLQNHGGQFFAMKFAPPKQQSMLVVLPSLNDISGERVVVDPNAMSEKGSIAIDFYVPSADGKLVAVSLSQNGSEDGTGRVFEVATGKELGDTVPRVNFPTAGGSIAWKHDGSGFYYTRYPRDNERPKEDSVFYQQVYFHKLGTDTAQDTYVIGKDFPKTAEIALRADDSGKYLLAAVANGDGGQHAFYVMDSTGKWTQLATFDDGIATAQFGRGKDARLYLLSRKDAPRGKVLSVGLSDLSLKKAKLVVPETSGNPSDENGRASIASIQPGFGALYVIDQMGGPTRVRVFRPGAKAGFEILPAPPVSSVGQIVSLASGDIALRSSTYLDPSGWYLIESKSGKATKTALMNKSPVTFEDAEVLREFAVSKDGTRIPMSIIRRKGTILDGSNPVLLNGYGGFNISEAPGFLGVFGRTWLDQGGVYVVANLRGGGEYGEEWHQAGKLTQKQNVFDDFAACAQHLIDEKYTSREHLAIMGGSNGGLLMGAEVTQHPELFRVAVSSAGIYDSLRVELDPNGTFNVTEYGTVKDPEQFKALYGYSPYQNVKNGTAYPSILFLTGENDGRVATYHSRKMIARLQAADSSGHPILLRTTSSAGHGIGTALSEAVNQWADMFSFMFDQMGIAYKP